MFKNTLACRSFLTYMLQKSKKTLPLSRNRYIKLSWNRKNLDRQRGFGPVSSSLGRCMLNIHAYVLNIHACSTYIHTCSTFEKAWQAEGFWKSLTGRGVLKKPHRQRGFWKAPQAERFWKSVTGRWVLDIQVTHSTPPHESPKNWIKHQILKGFRKESDLVSGAGFSQTYIQAWQTDIQAWQTYIHAGRVVLKKPDRQRGFEKAWQAEVFWKSLTGRGVFEKPHRQSGFEKASQADEFWISRSPTVPPLTNLQKIELNIKYWKVFVRNRTSSLEQDFPRHTYKLGKQTYKLGKHTYMLAEWFWLVFEDFKKAWFLFACVRH